MCDKLMATVPTLAVTGSNEPLRVDLCTSCQFVWFDPTEHEAWLRSTSLAATDERLPAETRAALARLPHAEPPKSVIAVARDDPPFFEWVPRGESSELKYLICILGYPVEVEPPPLHGRPWATWTLIGLVTAVSVYALLFMREAPLEWGFIPAELWRHGGLTLLTSFFLHVSPFHLIGNMYFLAVFGDNVEDLLGRGRYLGLLLMATVTGDLLHAAVRPFSLLPAIGASGAIAGVIVYYGLTFPRGRLRLMRFFRFVDLAVWGALVLWVSMQLIGTIVEASRGTHVAYAAHVGGAFAGLIIWSLSRRREPARVLSMASAGKS